MSLMFFQFGFKTLKQCEGIRRAARKPSQYFVVMKSAYFACAGLGDDSAECHLAITAQCYLSSAPD
jgi:hypothetical protein